MKGFTLCRALSILAALCLAVALLGNRPLTALMSSHMLVQIPLLILAGALAERALWMARRRVLEGTATLESRISPDRPGNATQPSWSYNEYGIPGLLLASLVGAAWMIPKALDDALTDWKVAAFKYIGLPLCGWVLGNSWRRAPLVVKLFFVGNFCWMSAIVGMIYLDQPARLCNAYLLGDQDWAGRGLIALAVLIPLVWLLVGIKPVRRALDIFTPQGRF